MGVPSGSRKRLNGQSQMGVAAGGHIPQAAGPMPPQQQLQRDDGTGEDMSQYVMPQGVRSGAVVSWEDQGDGGGGDDDGQYSQPLPPPPQQQQPPQQQAQVADATSSGGGITINLRRLPIWAWILIVLAAGILGFGVGYGVHKTMASR